MQANNWTKYDEDFKNSLVSLHQNGKIQAQLCLRSPASTRSTWASVTDKPVSRRTCSFASSMQRIIPSSRLRQAEALGIPLSSRMRPTVQPPMSMRSTEGSPRINSG